ncbi:MAG: neutral zinc metallopeptidase, partial [Pseudonocardiaceae bacterium]
CYSEATMKDYRDRVLPDIAGFFKAKYKTVPEEPSENHFIEKGSPWPSRCGVLDDRTLAYCLRDNNVYLGQVAMGELYDQVGDIAPAIAIVHEWGHNIQFRKGVPEPKNKEENVKSEQQADCVAGAWIQYVGQQGWLEPEDARTIDRLIEYLARAEPSNGDHGTPEGRRDAMLLGKGGGLSECNRFSPSTPIFTGRD